MAEKLVKWGLKCGVFATQMPIVTSAIWYKKEKYSLVSCVDIESYAMLQSSMAF